MDESLMFYTNDIAQVHQSDTSPRLYQYSASVDLRSSCRKSCRLQWIPAVVFTGKDGIYMSTEMSQTIHSE